MGCIYGGCDKRLYARGLCTAHYQAANNIVKSGKTTWEVLIEKGFALKRRRTRESAFVTAILREIGDTDANN